MAKNAKGWSHRWVRLYLRPEYGEINDFHTFGRIIYIYIYIYIYILYIYIISTSNTLIPSRYFGCSSIAELVKKPSVEAPRFAG